MVNRDHKAFLKIPRKGSEYRPVEARVKDYKEVFVLRPDEESQEQAARCLDCGTPFCMSGCPLGNIMPEWHDLVIYGKWQEAYELLSSTNNLPEMTGRVCPAPCEYACVLGANDSPVTIRENELAIIEHAFREGYVKANPPKTRTGKKVAVIGSGPAGIATAAQLNQAGHSVCVYEKYNKIGGLLRYGIPDFKLDKSVIDRRQKIYEEEGIEFKTGVYVGKDISADELKKEYDAICLTMGSRIPRDLDIEGRYLKGIHFAMDYLTQTNKSVSGEGLTVDNTIYAKDLNVVVIGGGDTGSDCIGTANRQGAKHVYQIEVMPLPPESRTEDFPWPKYPLLLKTTSSHEEGAKRDWSVLTKRFIGSDDHVEKLECVRVEFSTTDDGKRVMSEVPGSEFEIEADLVVLAIGFLHPEHEEFLKELGVEHDGRGNIKAANETCQTAGKGVFTAGDSRTGQSLIVRAIGDGRRAAHNIDKYLMGESQLPCP